VENEDGEILTDISEMIAKYRGDGRQAMVMEASVQDSDFVAEIR
jgi:hypothetical protein